MSCLYDSDGLDHDSCPGGPVRLGAPRSEAAEARSAAGASPGPAIRPGSRTFRRGAFTMPVQRRNLELPNRSLKDPDRAFKLSDSASDSGLQNHWQA